MDAELKLPAKVFFSCEEDGFSVVDGTTVRDMFDLANLQPMLRLDVGEGNVFEQRPLKVSSHRTPTNLYGTQSCVVLACALSPLACVRTSSSTAIARAVPNASPSASTAS